ncbi:MAG TPA: magnesium transporter, partial [Clostridiaceae bacterium]|nr:magnesium transporter [Clostridiaceae bacterium]
VNANGFFNFNSRTIDECLSNNQVPRLEVYESFSFGVINIINKEKDFILASELNFYLTSNYLIFVTKDSSSDMIKAVKDEIDGNSIDLERILYIFLDRLTASDNEILKDIEEDISDIEELVIKGENRDYIMDIVSLKKQLLFLKRYYEPLLDIAEGLEENENGLINEKSIRYFTILKDRMERLNRNVLNLRDYITQVREAYQAQVDINLNKIMKLFTVITAIFLPLSLIAGWYGMNFKYMPELGWVMGYPFAFLLSGIVVAICLIYFKKHDFI